MPDFKTGRPLAALVVASALLLPACGGSNPTLPDVASATILIGVTPNPVPPSQSPITGTVSIAFNITLAEISGLGGEVVFVNSTVYDPVSGAQAAATYFDGADLVVFVGTKRIEAGGTLEVPQTLSYVLADYATDASLSVAVQVKDDRGNVINQSVLVPITTPIATPE
jgi:hypothetical protein